MKRSMQSTNALTNTGLDSTNSTNKPQPERSDESIESDDIHGGGRSWVWEHAKRVKKKAKGPKGEVIHLALCKYCKSRIPADPSKNGTSSVAHHLRKLCKTSPTYMPQDKNQPLLTTDSKVGGVVPHVFNQKLLELDVMEFVIKGEHPFSIVEQSGYIKMMKRAEPRFKIPNRKKIATLVWDLFLHEKSKIIEIMRDQRVSITTDTWTSIQNTNYMVVTAHFMDSDWTLHKRIINFTKITSHKGEDIGRTLEVCLHNWVLDKIFSITVDNASANDSAVEYMKKRLGEMNTLLVGGRYLHLRCACHILNLVVKSGVKYLSSSIGAIRNSVKYIHSSPARLESFRDYAQFFKMDKKSNVPLDVDTRWNSTYKMLDVAYKYRKVFTRMANENVQFRDYFLEMEKGVIRVGPPSDDDWNKSLGFVHFLKKFYDATLKFSATKTVTSSLIWEELVSLQLEIETKVNDVSNLVLRDVAKAMKKKFDKYWGNWEKVNPIVFLGQVLNPCFKLQLLAINFKELGGGQDKVDKMIREIKVCLLNLYNEYKRGTPTNTTSEVIEQDEESMLNSCGGDLRKLRMLKMLIQERKEQRLVEISNEVDKYFAAPCENPFGEFNLINWWKGNTTNYPILSKIAKDIYAIPSSTVASENAFSLGGRVVDPFRASLNPKMVEALVCTSDWLRAEEFNFYKEPTEDMLELYREIEEVVDSSLTSQESTSAKDA